MTDVYDAMTTNRVYKKGVDPAYALKFLCTDGLKILDNKVINILQTNIPVNNFKTMDVLDKE